MPKRKNKFGRGRWSVVIGLTGGLGSGKSSALKYFKKAGAFTIDADIITRHILSKPNIVAQIKRRFGEEILVSGGAVDKRKLAGLVFKSVSKRKILEGLIHPRVAREMEGILNSKKGTVAVCEVPLLFEAGWENLFDSTVTISVPRRTAIRRLMKKGLSRTEIISRMRAQWPLAKKIRKSDFVIANEGSPKQLQMKVDRLWARLGSEISLNKQ